MTTQREQVAANVARLAAWITAVRLQDIPRTVQERAARDVGSTWLVPAT